MAQFIKLTGKSYDETKVVLVNVEHIERIAFSKGDIQIEFNAGALFVPGYSSVEQFLQDYPLPLLGKID